MNKKENPLIVQESSDVPHIHISEAVDTALNIIEHRKKGLLRGLKTPWRKFNKYIGGGIQKGSQYVIAGRSGVGKSAFVNLLIKGLFDFNRDEKIVVLYFNFEMPSYKQVIRKISKELSLTVNEILSADTSLTDENLTKINNIRTSLSSYNIYYIDVPINVSKIYGKIWEFHKKFPGYHIINVFDHSRLVTDESERDEMQKIGRLSKLCMFLKKKINCSNIIVSQLNRNIEAPERAKTGHEPQSSDIFGADSIYQDADIVVVPHRPESFHLDLYYGFPTKDFIALHILKNRDGEVGLIPFKHNLAVNNIEEL